MSESVCLEEWEATRARVLPTLVKERVLRDDTGSCREWTSTRRLAGRLLRTWYSRRSGHSFPWATGLDSQNNLNRLKEGTEPPKGRSVYYVRKHHAGLQDLLQRGPLYPNQFIQRD